MLLSSGIFGYYTSAMQDVKPLVADHPPFVVPGAYNGRGMETQGERLRAFLEQRTGGERGWVTSLARATGIERVSLYAYFSGRVQPDLSTISRLADAVGSRPYEIVAAMTGDWPVVSVHDPAVRELLRELLREPGE